MTRSTDGSGIAPPHGPAAQSSTMTGWFELAGHVARTACEPALSAPARTAALWATAVDQARFWMDAPRALSDVMMHAMRRQQEALAEGLAAPPQSTSEAADAASEGQRPEPRAWRPRPNAFVSAAEAWRDAGTSIFETQWRAYTQELDAIARSTSSVQR